MAKLGCSPMHKVLHGASWVHDVKGATICQSGCRGNSALRVCPIKYRWEEHSMQGAL